MIEIIKKTFNALMTVMIISLVAMWTADIIILLYRGMMHEAFNEIIMFTLVVLCYTATQRMERLSKTNALLAEEVQRLDDVKKFVETLRDMVKKNEMEQEVADIMKEHFENKED